MSVRIVLTVVLVLTVCSVHSHGQHPKKLHRKSVKNLAESALPNCNFFDIRLGMTEDEVLQLLRDHGEHTSVGLSTVVSDPFRIEGVVGELKLSRGGTYTSSTVQTIEWTAPLSDWAYRVIMSACYRRLGNPDASGVSNEFSDDVNQWYVSEGYNGRVRSATISVYPSFGKLCMVKKWNGY